MSVAADSAQSEDPFPLKVVIFHFGRSGSTVLVNMINHSTDVLWIDEALSRSIRDSIEISGLPELISYPENFARARRKNRPTVGFGYEIKYLNYVKRYHKITDPLSHLERLRELGYKVVLLRRRNTLRRLLSVYRAKDIKIWHLKDTAAAPVDRKTIIDTSSVTDWDTGGTALPLLDAVRKSADVEKRLWSTLQPLADLELEYERDIEKDPRMAFHRFVEHFELSHRPAEPGLRRTITHPRDAIENYAEIVDIFTGTDLEWMVTDA